MKQLIKFTPMEKRLTVKTINNRIEARRLTNLDALAKKQNIMSENNREDHPLKITYDDGSVKNFHLPPEIENGETLKNEYFGTIRNPQPIQKNVKVTTEQHDSHYQNPEGMNLYEFAVNYGLNAYEFDIVKRIVRCRKKGQFKSDIEKTIRTCEMYLNDRNK